MTHQPMKLHESILTFWKTALITIFILSLCLIPANSLQKIDPFKVTYEDIVAHFCMFLGFSFTLAYDLKKYIRKSGRTIRVWFMTIVISLLLGIGTEMLQYLLVGLNRTANAGDFLFDSVGTAAGVIAARFILR